MLSNFKRSYIAFAAAADLFGDGDFEESCVEEVPLLGRDVVVDETELPEVPIKCGESQ